MLLTQLANFERVLHNPQHFDNKNHLMLAIASTLLDSSTALTSWHSIKAAMQPMPVAIILSP